MCNNNSNNLIISSSSNRYRIKLCLIRKEILLIIQETLHSKRGNNLKTLKILYLSMEIIIVMIITSTIFSKNKVQIDKLQLKRNQ